MLEVKLAAGLAAQGARVGDGIETVLRKPVKLGNKTLLPKGSVVRGRVQAVQLGDRKPRIRSSLRVAFDEIVLPGGDTVAVGASLKRCGGLCTVDASGLMAIPGLSRRQIAWIGFQAVAGIGGMALLANRPAEAIAYGALACTPFVVAAVELPRTRYVNVVLRKGARLTLALDRDLTFPAKNP